MSNMFNLLKKIYFHRMAPVSNGTDAVNNFLLKELPFNVYEYPSGIEHNGWVVPHKWEVKKALIKKDGHIIYDGMTHPLGVIGYSQSFCGQISLEELKKHLFYKPEQPDSIVYHCELFYKVGKKNWGFSMPLNQINSLMPGEYQIELETTFEKGTMKVLDFYLPGRKKDTIILNAHNCHAAQANDDVAGIVVGIEIMKRLSKKHNKYSYRFIVAPEHLGTVFYLANLKKKTLRTFKYALFLEMLGNNNRFALQKSFTGKTLIDYASIHYLRKKFPDTYVDDFRKIVGNDETVWESPGFEIPTISLSRAPYPEYHTNMDNENIISEEKLEEAVDAVLGIINILESNCIIKRNFNGLVALSNPKYDLYIATNDPAIPKKISENQKKWNYLMDCLPRYFDNKTSVLDIAIKHDIFYEDLYNYIIKFEEKGLIKIKDI